jgi:parallel beta-helix repeat protein
MLASRSIRPTPFLAILFLSGSCAWADTLYVPDDYTTIQSAIDAATNGDVVEIEDGTYTGDGNKDLDFFGKAITVRSASGAPDLCVIDCESSGRGFIFQSGEGPDSQVQGLTVTNGLPPDADPSGGAIYAIESSPTFENCIFRSNITASVYGANGGAIYTLDSALTLRRCIISENRAYRYGGGLYAHGSSGPTLVECLVNDNEAHKVGGIGCRHGTLIDCTISRNTADEIGGVSCWEGTTLTECVISENRATSGDAGGVHTGDSAVFTRCTITDNVADKQGGGVQTASASFSECTIIGNSASSGGGIYCSGGDVFFERCVIADNAKTGISCWSADDLHLVDCEIDSNVGTSGGGLYLHHTDAVIVSCAFKNNISYGAGGGIRTYQSKPTILNCVFFGNVAQERGGAAFFNFSSDALVANCLLSHNEAYSGGGGIGTNQDSTPTFVGCTLVRNVSYFRGGGAAFCDSTSPTFAACVIRDNLPTQIEALFDEPQLRYCNVEDGAAEPWFGEGCIDAEPNFVDPDGPDNDPTTWEDNDYRLAPGSPCIDAGDNTAVPTDEFDLDDDGDAAEPLPFELDGNPRFIDDPDTTDTGNGTSPIVDMGAYEFQTDGGCAGDVDGDGDTDQSDLGLLLVSYEKPPDDPLFDPRADLDGDGEVGQPDLGILLADYECGT